MLAINLLGPPLVLLDGQPLSIPRRQTRALLFYLAATGTAITRGKLAGIFWPGESETDARRSLTLTLGKLRGAPALDEVIQTYHDTISLDQERLAVDVWDFRRLVGSVSRAVWTLPQDSLLPPETLLVFSRAAALWRSTNFLAGDEFAFSESLEHWHIQTGETLQRDLLRILERLTGHELALGNFKNALAWAQKAIELDDFDEKLNATLLRLLLETGQRHEARLHYQKFEQICRDELDEALPQEILAMRARIFNEPRLETLHHPVWPIRESVQAPFTGQGPALGQLRSAYQAGGAALVLGEAGMGKTRLVQEFYQRLESTPRLLLGVCRAGDSNLPYHPWMGMLERALSPEELIALPAYWAAPLVTLLPQLASLRDDLPRLPEVLSPYNRTTLMQAVVRLFEGLAGQRPLLVFMDDVHWADESTLALLAHLLEHGFRDPRQGLLVVSSRMEEANESLDQWMLVSSPRRLRKIYLEQLSREEIASLAGHILGAPIPQAFLERLTQDSGGNIFFLLEILHAVLRLPEQTDLEKIDRLPLPTSIHQMIESRLQSISAEARSVLLTAAILGSRFNLLFLERAVSLPRERLAQVVDELEKAHLVARDAYQEEGFGYAFVHEKIRESLLQNISPARRRHLHLQVARALQEQPGGSDSPQAAVLAHHFEHAGENAQAFDFWVEAGRNAYRLASVADANAAYRRAERLIPRAPALRDEQIHSLYSSWSDMAFKNDDQDTLEGINRTLLEIGRTRGSDLLIGSAFDGLSDACMAANRFSEGLRYTEDALPYATRSGNLYELMETNTHHGVFLFMLGRLAEAQIWFRRSIDLAGETRDPLLLGSRAHARAHMAASENFLGRPAAGLEYARQSLEDYASTHDLYGQAVAYSQLGLSHYFRADFENGLHAPSQGIELAKRTESWRMLGYLCAYHSMNSLDNGQIGTAWDFSRRALELGQKRGHHEIASAGYKLQGDIYFRLQAYQPASNCYQQGIAIGGENFVALDSLQRLGMSLACLGDPSGEQIIEDAYNKARLTGIETLASFIRGMWIGLLLKQGRLDLVEQYRRQNTEAARANGYAQGETLDAYWQSQLLIAKGNYPRALLIMEVSVRLFEKNPMPWGEITSNCLLAQLLRKLGRDPSLPAQRVHALLDRLSASLLEAPLRPEWDQFAARVLSSLEADDI